MRRLVPLLTLATLLAGCVVRPATADPGRAERRDDRHDRRVEARTGWDKLGERWIQGGRDRDVIHVGRRDGSFRVIKLRAEHSALVLDEVRVVFGDGTSFSPGTRVVFDRGTWSRDIDLPGGARVIKRVELRYGNLPGGGRAQVDLWAR